MSYYIKKILQNEFKKKYKVLFDIFTHLTDKEKIILYKLSKQVKTENAVFVEIGSYYGASSCFLAEGLKAGKIYCIDTWQNDAMSEGSRDTFCVFKENTRKYRDKIVEVRGWSYDVVDVIKSLNKPVDLLFIDGDHSYEGVKKDWDLYSPMLKRNSVVIFHDYGWAEGVQKVVNEDVVPLVGKHSSLSNMWWGWIK